MQAYWKFTFFEVVYQLQDLITDGSNNKEEDKKHFSPDFPAQSWRLQRQHCPETRECRTIQKALSNSTNKSKKVPSKLYKLHVTKCIHPH